MKRGKSSGIGDAIAVVGQISSAARSSFLVILSVLAKDLAANFLARCFASTLSMTRVHFIMHKDNRSATPPAVRRHRCRFFSTDHPRLCVAMTQAAGGD